MTDLGPDPEPAVAAPMNGHDQIRTAAVAPGDPSTGVLHRGWRFTLVIGCILALNVATFIGVLAGNHYSAKAASQQKNAALVKQTQMQGAQILALTNEVHARQASGQQTQALIQSETNLLVDATTPGGKIYEAAAKNQSQAIGLLITCLQSVIEHPSQPLPAACPAPA